MFDLTDISSDKPVTSKLCNTIGGKPIVATSWMYYASNAKEIDLSSIDTSNVVNMEGMFWCAEVTSLDLSKFDTSNVIFI